MCGSFMQSLMYYQIQMQLKGSSSWYIFNKVNGQVLNVDNIVRFFMEI